MELEFFDGNVSVHQGLGDNPNTDNSLSAAELKALFDRPAELIKEYLNEKVVPAINKKVEAADVPMTIDRTLSKDGHAADAAAVGEALKKKLDAEKISSWALAAQKPAYTASEVGASPTGHTHSASEAGAAAADHNHSGVSISPAMIELIPPTSAGHGGYIDFHFKGDTGDYTTRLIENNGALQINDHQILTTANITAVYGVSVTFDAGKCVYENSAIKATSVVLVQRRSGTAGSATTGMFGTTSAAGSVTIVADNTDMTAANLNIIIINL